MCFAKGGRTWDLGYSHFVSQDYLLTELVWHCSCTIQCAYVYMWLCACTMYTFSCLQKELLKTKEALFHLATNLRQLPDRYMYIHTTMLDYRKYAHTHTHTHTHTHSSAQLLEPFKLEHGIGSVGGALSSSAGAIPDLERAPGGATSMMAQGVLGPNTELEDPPGLYEKVHVYSVLTSELSQFEHMQTW